MPIKTVAILSPGDMGHNVGKSLNVHGLDVITCLEGRSETTRQYAERANFRDVPSLEDMVSQADLVLSIMPPSVALENGRKIAAAMKKSGQAPPFADCNATSPTTVKRIGEAAAEAGAPFIDVGILGQPPGRGKPPHFYVSGPDLSAIMELDGMDLKLCPTGTEIGRASAVKMCYAALTKGTATLHTAVLLAAESLGVSAEIHTEYSDSQEGAFNAMKRMVPRLPADSGRWIGEMEEIAATFEDAGVTPRFHQGALDIYNLLIKTPFAAETRETIDPNRTMEESVKIYAQYLDGRSKAAE